MLCRKHTWPEICALASCVHRQWQDWAPSARFHAPWEPHMHYTTPRPATTAGMQAAGATLAARQPRPATADVRLPAPARRAPATAPVSRLPVAELSGWADGQTSATSPPLARQPVNWGSPGMRIDSEGRIVNVAQRQEGRLPPVKP